MKPVITNIIRNKAIFLFLLPLFFVFHGFVEFYNLIPPGSALLLIFWYALASLILWAIFYFLFRNRIKAALFSFFMMCCYFFFGSVQDMLNAKFPGSFVTKYSFLLSLLLLALVAVFVWLKKRKREFGRAVAFLNILMLVLIAWDLVQLTVKLANKQQIITGKRSLELDKSTVQDKPDIYFILADGYTGNIPLKKFFNFDNSAFTDSLLSKGFYVIDSSFSNYNYTVFSVGSTLNMDYLNTSTFFKGKRDLPLAFDAVRNSRLQQFLETAGYEIHNCSIFDMNGHRTKARKTLLKFDRSPLTTQTLLYRVYRDIGYHLFAKIPFLRRKQENILYYDLQNNQELDMATRQIASTYSGRPKFIYTHLVMPHLPYYYDSAGTLNPPEKLTDANFHANKSAYIGYLKFANRKFNELITYILAHSKKPPVIILCGDHACRECMNSKEESPYETTNFSAIYLPGKNYSGLYKGMSNVNLFRQVLNNELGQHLPMLKDSTTIIHPDKSYLR